MANYGIELGRALLPLILGNLDVMPMDDMN